MSNFKFGDRVVHADRPEWGGAVVTAAQNIQHEGKPVQRLTLRFDRAGLKTISTAFADIQPEGAAERMSNGAGPESPPPSGGVTGEQWLESLANQGRTPEQVFAAIPEPCRDPFVSAETRLERSLALYRYDSGGAPLLDWAASQTGLRDPLSAFTRQQLEQYFDRFAHERDRHLQSVLRELKDPTAPKVKEIVEKAPPGARDALRRISARR